MQDHTPSLLSFIGQALGVPLGAIPLSFCRLQRAYLLEKDHLDTEGTAILLAVPYLVSGDAHHPRRNLSLYAVPEDYHRYFEGLKQSLLPRIRDAYPDFHFGLFGDHSPIAEVEAAVRCGLGILGKHGLLITPDYGSFVFLGEIITDMPWGQAVGTEEAFEPREMGFCQGCDACIRACPGGCLPTHRDTCISAISQKKGMLSPEEIRLLTSQPLVWGCDVCQLVCPHNRSVIAGGQDTPVAYFAENRIIHIDQTLLEQMEDADFSRRAYAWRGKDTIGRNLSLLGKGDAYDEPDTGSHGKR